MAVRAAMFVAWAGPSLLLAGCMCPPCPLGTTPRLADETCSCEPECPGGTSKINGQCGTYCDQLDCAIVPVAPELSACVESLKKVRDGETFCACVPDQLKPGFTIDANACAPKLDCAAQYGPGYRQEGNSCIPCDNCLCSEAPGSPACIPVRCGEYPELRAQNTPGHVLCIDDPPPPVEGCVNGCHLGIEDPHPWISGPLLTCSGCHGGDPSGTTVTAAHVPIPTAWQAGSQQPGRPNLRYYWNYITLYGAETFDGGLEWLRFRNPGDLRIADQSCGKAGGCHDTRVQNVRRSGMATNVGHTGVVMSDDGVPGSYKRGAEALYNWDANEGATSGQPVLEAINYDPSFVGSRPRLNKYTYENRESKGTYTEVDLLKEVYDKFCNDCHLGAAGPNHRYATFRSSGCSSCHVPYSLDGRSRSADPMMKKTEPSYPAAWASIANFNPNDLADRDQAWLGPERAHPISHRISRQIVSQRCGVCHAASNRTDSQYRGIRFDPNRTCKQAVATGQLLPSECVFTTEIDNQANPDARYQGATQDQLLKYEDWNHDGLDDSPADVHYVAGMECMDCHTSAEMHNEIKFPKSASVTNWQDPAQVKDMSGALWSHKDQMTEIECAHCHGNLEFRALPKAVDARNPIKNLLVCPEPGEVIPGYTTPPECGSAFAGYPAGLGAGRWLKTKFNGSYHYVSQVVDTVRDHNARRPDGTEVYSANASVFHGRFDGANLENGLGPCSAADPVNCRKNPFDAASPQVAQGFSHLGQRATSPIDQMAGGLECYACHSTWVNGCFGCHLTLSDSNGTANLFDFSRATGELTAGLLNQVDFSYIDPLAIQFGINSEGKISQHSPFQKKHVRHIDRNNNSYFGTQRIVNDDAATQYNIYRHRSGYGTRRFATENVGFEPGGGGVPFEQDPRMDQNTAQGFNQMVPHTTQRASPRMDCELCHLNQDSSNADWVTARLGVNPNGFGNVSAFLNALDGQQIIRANTGQPINVDAAAGFRFDANTDPAAHVVDEQLDWVVLPDGFPLAQTNYPMMVNRPYLTFDPAYARQYPVQAQIAGPLNQALLNKLTGGTVRVQNVGVPFIGRQ